MRRSFLLCLFALTAATVTQAATVTVTLTGTVDSGSTDGYLGTAPVFGTAGSLVGKSFTLTFYFDDSYGTESASSCSGSLGYSNDTGTVSSSSHPGATLTIGSGSFNYGALPTSSVTWSVDRYMHATSCYGYNQIDYGWSETYTGSYSGSSTLGAGTNYLASGNFSTGDWRGSQTTASVTGSYFPFSIDYSYNGTLAGYASGYLVADHVSVSSAGFAVPTSETANWVNFWSDQAGLSDPNTVGPVGLWSQSLSVDPSYLSNTLGAWMVAEQNVNNGTYTPSDTCNDALVGTDFHYPPPAHLSGGTWHVTTDNVWGDATKDGSIDQYDANGELDEEATVGGQNWHKVAYLRSISAVPCSLIRYQQMQIDFGDGSGYQNYGAVNTLVGTIRAYDVLASKSNDTAGAHTKTY